MNEGRLTLEKLLWHIKNPIDGLVRDSASSQMSAALVIINKGPWKAYLKDLDYNTVADVFIMDWSVTVDEDRITVEVWLDGQIVI